MTITKDINADALSLAVEGRLDTVTAPELEAEIKALPDNIRLITLDLEKLEYISSAGLRVLLAMQKLMNNKGELIIKNVCEQVNEVFDITGFSDILNIQ